MPPPAPTELLAEDIHDLRATNHRIAARMDSLESAIRDLGRDLGSFRADVAGKLGAINGNLESLRVRLDDSVSVAKWTVGILAPIVMGLIGAGFWLTWHAAKLDSRVERVETSVYQKEAPKLPSQPITPKPGP